MSDPFLYSTISKTHQKITIAPTIFPYVCIKDYFLRYIDAVPILKKGQEGYVREQLIQTGHSYARITCMKVSDTSGEKVQLSSMIRTLTHILSAFKEAEQLFKVPDQFDPPEDGLPQLHL